MEVQLSYLPKRIVSAPSPRLQLSNFCSGLDRAVVASLARSRDPANPTSTLTEPMNVAQLEVFWESS